MDRTTAYAKLVCSGKRLTGEAERQACQRHLDDMSQKGFAYTFDVARAEKHIDIANTLTIAEGETPAPLITRGFQNFIIGSLNGWRLKRSKELRYREAYIQIGRQNGKSFIAGTMANDKSSFSGYKEGRVFCTATKQDQANIVWDELAKFIRSDRDLLELYKIREHDRTIVSLITGTTIKAIGRDTKSADGFRSILAIIDEYHAHPTDQMYKLMFDGQVRVSSALTLAITTAGFDLNSACYEQYQFSKKVLSGVVKTETLFVYISEMDKDDDIWDYHNWAKANPLNLWKDDTTIDMDMVKRYAEKAIDAKEKGGNDLLNFQTKSLNVWVEYAGGQYLDLGKWKQCASDLTLADMTGKECYLGLDLSQGGDLTSTGLVFPIENDKVFIHSQSFLPELRLREHEKTDKAPYRIWANQGLLTLTSGMYGLKTDYKYIINYLLDSIEKYNLKIIGCGYDPANAGAFLSDLELLGCNLTAIVQSARSLNDCTVDFRQSIEAGLILYDKNSAVLSWSAANAKTVSNSFGEIKVEKETASKRIDPIYAILDGYKVWFANKGEVKQSANEAYDDWAELMRGRKGAVN